MSEEGYKELQRDYLALVITVVNIVDGAAFLFGKENPMDRRNWKAELELEQYRSILELNKNNSRNENRGVD